jgi:hypothetical protein
MNHDEIAKEIADAFKKEEELVWFKKMQMYFSKKEDQSWLPKKEAINKIGAWRYDVATKTYNRVFDEDSWWWEQTKEKIKVEKEPGCKRVCLIGESAAYGMFFSPIITPAKACEKILNEECYNSSLVEVIDLTRICMNSQKLIETVKSVRNIEPDFIIIFAGNNWFADSLYDRSLALDKKRKYYEAFEQGAFNQMPRLFHDDFYNNSLKIFDEIDKAIRNENFKTFFVIPPSNLHHWQRRTPLFKGKYDFVGWHKRLEDALCNLKNGDYERALLDGRAMIDIDKNTCSTSQRVVADALIHLNREGEALGFLKKEASLAIVNSNITSFPFAPCIIKKILSGENTYHFEAIDLERILQERTKKSVLGREVFVDYCHLNPKGFVCLAEVIAKKVLYKKSLKKEYEEEDILCNIDSNKLSASYFYIALYNSHFNQPIANEKQEGDIKKFLLKAVSTSPLSLDMMEAYVKAKSAKEGFNLSKSAQDLLSLTGSQLDLQISQSCMGVDSQTIEVICDVLDENDREGKFLKMGYIKQFEKDFYKKGYDLTHPYFVERINAIVRETEDHEINTRRALPFYKAYWPENHFELPITAAQQIEIEIIGRTKTLKSSSYTLYINDYKIGCFTLNNTWSLEYFSVTEDIIKQGFNRLTLKVDLRQNNFHLNDNEPHHEKELLLGLPTDLTYVFGEFHAILVKPASMKRHNIK